MSTRVMISSDTFVLSTFQRNTHWLRFRSQSTLRRQKQKWQTYFRNQKKKLFEERALSISSEFDIVQPAGFLSGLYNRSLFLISLSEKGILTAEEQRYGIEDVEEMRVVIREQVQNSDYSKITQRELRDITDDLLVRVGFQEERIASAASYQQWNPIVMYKSFISRLHKIAEQDYEHEITDQEIAVELEKMGRIFRITNSELLGKIESSGAFGSFYAYEGNSINILDGLILLTRNSSNHQAVKAGTRMMVIGHEIHHGLFNEFLSIENETNYQMRQTCLMSHMEAVCDEYKEAGCHSGDITLNEDSADLEGLQAAYLWMERKIGKETASILQNTTNQQLFFYSFGSMFCTKQEDTKEIRGDEHSTAAARINGILSLMPSFKKAFHCAYNSRMMKLASQTTQHCNFFGSEVR